jgi:low affinity Fe/Cu permease
MDTTTLSSNDIFRRFAKTTAALVGSPWSFILAVLLIVVWALLGPMFHYSDTWQLVINTSTTIVTFLVVFLIQNTQNRDARALHLKLDELLRAVAAARTGLVELENLSDEQLERLQKEFDALRLDNRAELEKLKDSPSAAHAAKALARPPASRHGTTEINDSNSDAERIASAAAG